MQAFMCRLPCTYEFLKRIQTDMFQETNARMKSAASLLLSSLFSDPDVAQKVLQNKAIAVLASAMPALLLHDDVRVQTVVARVISALLRRADLGAQVLQAGQNHGTGGESVGECNAGGAGGVLEAVELLLQSKVEDLKLAAGSILETALQYHVEQRPRVLARPRLLAALLRAPVEAVRGDSAAAALQPIIILLARTADAESVLCSAGLLGMLLRVTSDRDEAPVLDKALVAIASLHHSLHLSQLVSRNLGRNVIRIATLHAGSPLERQACALLRHLCAGSRPKPGAQADRASADQVSAKDQLEEKEMSQRTRRGVLIGDGLVVYLSHVIQRACEEDKVVEEKKRRLSDDEAVAAERDAVIYEACSCVKELVVLDADIARLVVEENILHLVRLAQVRETLRPPVRKLTMEEIVLNAILPADAQDSEKPQVIMNEDEEGAERGGRGDGVSLQRHVEWQALRVVAALVCGSDGEILAYVLRDTDALVRLLEMSVIPCTPLRCEAAHAINTVCVHCRWFSVCEG